MFHTRKFVCFLKFMSLRMKHRRQRQRDPLASAEAVRDVLQKLRETLPGIVPEQQKSLEKMLYAVRHLSRYSATDTKRGRPSKWKREDLLKVSSNLTSILEGKGFSVNASSFISHYLQILRFPSDIVVALEDNQINLFEAEQLSRIKAGCNGWTEAQAKKKRSELLAAHLQAKLSGRRLQQRVNETLRGADNIVVNETRNAELQEEALLLEDFDPYDTSHLFWEEIKMLGFAFRGIKPEAVTEENLEELLRLTVPVWSLLMKLQQQSNRKTLN